MTSTTPQTIAERIEQKLRAGLNPTKLIVTDESHHHAGHAGHDGRGESHFNVLVVSEQFNSISRVQRQRMVYGLLNEELNERIHALQLKTLTPNEANE